MRICKKNTCSVLHAFIYRYKAFTIGILLILSQSMLSCKKFVAVDPPNTAVSGKMIFTNLSLADAAVNGIYSRMAQTSGGFISGSNSMTTLFGLSADEFINQSTNNLPQREFYQNEVNAGNPKLSSNWSELYNYIYCANSIIEGLKSSVLPQDASRNQLEGEALFIRAFSHFYLAELFGSVPYITSTDYRINQFSTSLSTVVLYSNIATDLNQAKQLLKETYSSDQRIRVNKYAAIALLARIYLYQSDWKNAESESSLVIQNSLYKLEENLDHTFLTDSQEAILQLQSVVPRISTFDGFNYILTSAPTNISLDPATVASITNQDQRKQHWIGSFTEGSTTFYYPNKYKLKLLPAGSKPTEYLCLLRLSEQYLIRAEARAQLNKLSLSREDLNKIRTKSGLEESQTDDQEILLSDIATENRIEFLAEWGHRWLDLKRTGKATTILGKIKPNWNPSALNFPLPQIEVQRNPHLTAP